MTLVPLDATDDVPFTTFFVDALAEHAVEPGGAGRAHDHRWRTSRSSSAPGYSFWDTLATALVFRPELATWDRAPVMITASQDAGAGWIDRWDQGVPVRFARQVPDPLAFEREYLSVLTGETVTQVRPDPDVTISFDGERCTIRTPALRCRGPRSSRTPTTRQPREVGGGSWSSSATSSRTTQLRAFLGPDGSILPAGHPAAGRAGARRLPPTGSDTGDAVSVGDRRGVRVGRRRGLPSADLAERAGGGRAPGIAAGARAQSRQRRRRYGEGEGSCSAAPVFRRRPWLDRPCGRAGAAALHLARRGHRLRGVRALLRRDGGVRLAVGVDDLVRAVRPGGRRALPLCGRAGRGRHRDAPLGADAARRRRGVGSSARRVDRAWPGVRVGRRRHRGVDRPDRLGPRT